MFSLMISPMYKIYKIDSSKSIDDQMVDIFADFGTPGVSPGYAGAVLGMTRQSVDYAIRTGSLRACKIYEKKRHIATLIDTASIDLYREMRASTPSGRIPRGSLSQLQA